MADLILLNGPPASGKSTLAECYVDANPLALNLDIDVLRRLIGGWAENPHAAGLTARSMALAIAGPHLAAGHNVIVPQFLGRTDFIEQLDDVAVGVGARFIEVALWLDRSEAIAAFTQRSADPTSPAHRDAALLVERSSRPDPVGWMYDEFVTVIEQRPQAIRVAVIRGDINTTFQHFTEALR